MLNTTNCLMLAGTVAFENGPESSSVGQLLLKFGTYGRRTLVSLSRREGIVVYSFFSRRMLGDVCEETIIDCLGLSDARVL